MSQPKILEVLGSHRGPNGRMTDKNLKRLHLYLMMALIQCDEVICKRGLADGEQVHLRLHRPAEARWRPPATPAE